MERTLTISFTSDTHGYFSPVDYAKNAPAPTGVANCAAAFPRNGNSLIIDGGDTLQGSPFTYWLHRCHPHPGAAAGEIMRRAGYQFLTLGNHDFNFGRATLEEYLAAAGAVCLCANVEGLAHVEKTALVTLENGLRVGLTGVTTPFINLWERPENLRGITISDPVPAAEQALRELKERGAEITVCIYHGGFERDLATGAVLSETKENQAWEICQRLDFDILLTGHQHMAVENARVAGTFTCQPPDKARSFIRLTATLDDAGGLTAESELCPAGAETRGEIADFLAPLEQENAAWLDKPVGRLDTALIPASHLAMAADGSLIANFFNQVQLEASGADISATSLGNEIRGFDRDVTIRDVVATYIYPNTLKTLRVDRRVLKAALERSAEYFDLDDSGALRISESFLSPKVEHYNFDYISGVEATVDVSRPKGDRVLSIRRQGRELPEDVTLTLCLNNYRASGAGEYPFYPRCELVRDQPTEIAEMIMDYITAHRDITVDKTRWLRVIW